jgi:hypothetical protein
MIHTFATREEAAIYASSRRSDGYFAEILDEGMGAIYGPLAIGGIRVVVSDEPLEDPVAEPDGSPPPPAPPRDSELLTLVRLLVVGIAGIGLLAMVIGALSLAPRDPGELAMGLYRLLKNPVLIALAFLILGPLMGGFTRWLRGERVSPDTGWLRWLVIAILGLLMILAAL